jgi:hypothetical protein
MEQNDFNENIERNRIIAQILKKGLRTSLVVDTFNFAYPATFRG